MYMDCSFEGDEPERSKVVDHTPTDEEWKKLLECFPQGKAGEVIRALKSTGNTPLERDVHSSVTWGRIGGMNNALKRAGLVFRLTPAFKDRGWDHIRLERQKSSVEDPPPGPLGDKVMRCCP